MRRKSERVLSFVGRDEDLPKTVREFREKYKGISRVLDATGASQLLRSSLGGGKRQ
jgi:hypothetical protein